VKKIGPPSSVSGTSLPRDGLNRNTSSLVPLTCSLSRCS